VVLTTAGGVEEYKGKNRNELSVVVRDYRNLRAKAVKSGILVADCMCPQLSPSSRVYKNRDGTMKVSMGHLIHLHGFWRLAIKMSEDELSEFLRDDWSERHGAKIVWVTDLTEFEKQRNYCVKDALHDYAKEEFRARLLKSKNWLPVGHKEVIRELVKWYIENRYDWENEDYYGRNKDFPFVAYSREIFDDYLKRWCYGEEIWIEFKDRYVMIYRDKIKYFIKGEDNGSGSEG